jgi:hypothetical protein
VKRTAIRVVVALLPLALFIGPVRAFLERDMALHMLVEFPLLVAGGAAASRWIPAAIARAVGQCDWKGIATLLAFTLVSAFWMIPAALDAALLVPEVGAAKYASWWLVGLALPSALRAAPPALVLFFAGNVVWMSATAGLLYADAPQRLCLSYMEASQRHAGAGLLAYAVAMTLAGFATWSRR